MKSFQGESRLLQPPSRWWLVLCIVLLAAGIVFLCAFGWAQYGYLKSSRYYTDLASTAQQSTGEQAASQIDFETLRQINPDAAAWLEMPGLSLSLPVVQAQDNDTYLHKSFDGSASPLGCLFFSAASKDGNDLYRVIYGHNIHTGEMFAGLVNYTDEAFYQKYPTFILCTPAGDKICRIFSCHSVTDGDDLYRTDRTKGEDYNSFVQQLYDASDYVTGVPVPEGSQVLTLSTCASSYTSGLQRYVIHAYIEDSAF